MPSPQKTVLKLTLLALLVVIGLDRLVVSWDAHWRYASQIPPLLVDPYRLEGRLRSTAPGPQNLLVVGNSTAEFSVDETLLETHFDEQGLQVTKLTTGGVPTLNFGLLAEKLLALEPRAVLLVTSVSGLRADDFLDDVAAWNLRDATALFSLDEILEEPRFHLDGLVRSLNVFARHRRSMQLAVAVELGLDNWELMRAYQVRDEMMRGLANPEAALDHSWLGGKEKRVWENKNTQALSYLAERLSEIGAKLVVVAAPPHPTTRLLGASQLAELEAELKRLAGRGAGFTYLEFAQLPKLRTKHFEDMVHTNERGAAKFSTALALALEPLLGPEH